MSAIAVMFRSLTPQPCGVRLGETVKGDQLFENHRERLERQHRRTLAGSPIRILMGLEKHCRNPNRGGGARKNRSKFALTARSIAEAARLRYGMGRIEDDRIAGP